jgi:REP element-mobilizing transposase RayT
MKMPTQLELNVKPKHGWGGRRPGAGRPKTGRAVGLPHRPRPHHEGRHPAHITWRVARGVPSLRKRRLARIIGRTIRAASRRHEKRRSSFGVIHFSIQDNHIHLIVEAGSKRTMTRELRGLGIWLARGLNQELGSTGRVIADRYHARPLATPREVRSALVYVLQNHKHHTPSAYLVDENSSARWFTGWEAPLPEPDTPAPVREARTWLGGVGWLRAGGAIRFCEGPAS